MSRALLLLVLVLLSACRAPGQPADPALARAACGLVPEDPLSAGRRASGELVRPLDADCAAWLGQDLHVDWAGFGHQPREVVRAEDAADAAVTGARLLLATDLGTVGEVLDDPQAPQWVAAVLADEAARVDLDDQAPAADLVYAWVTSRTARIAPRETPDGTTAVYSPATGTIWLDPHAPALANPTWIASVLVHETTHQAAPGHDPCSDPAETAGCDADLAGAYGLQSYVTWRHGTRVATDTTEGLVACLDATTVLDFACSMIEDPRGSAICTTTPAC